MKNAERIDVRLSQNRCASAKSVGEEAIVYRIPYQIIKCRQVDLSIENPFVVYILVGKDSSGNDSIYVGKSTKGIDNRPASHGDKGCVWSQCFIITEKGDSFLNDGIIQYMEYQVWSRVNGIARFNNTTVVTNAGTANEMDRYSADKLLDRAYRLLDVLGLDLIVDQGDIVIDHVSNSTVEKPKSLDDLDLSPVQRELMAYIRDSLLNVDPHLRIVVNDGSWNYVRFSFADRNKALVYCRGMKKKGIIRAYIQGTSDLFDDPEVLPVSSSEVYGSCKSTFDVKDRADAAKLVDLCIRAYRRF